MPEGRIGHWRYANHCLKSPVTFSQVCEKRQHTSAAEYKSWRCHELALRSLVTSHQSPVTSHQPPATSHQPPVTSHESQKSQIKKRFESFTIQNAFITFYSSTSLMQATVISYFSFSCGKRVSVPSMVPARRISVISIARGESWLKPRFCVMPFSV